MWIPGTHLRVDYPIDGNMNIVTANGEIVDNGNADPTNDGNNQGGLEGLGNYTTEEVQIAFNCIHTARII